MNNTIPSYLIPWVFSYYCTHSSFVTFWDYQIAGRRLLKAGVDKQKAIEFFHQAIDYAKKDNDSVANTYIDNYTSYNLHQFFGNKLLEAGHTPEAIEFFDHAITAAKADGVMQIGLYRAICNKLLRAGHKQEASKYYWEATVYTFGGLYTWASEHVRVDFALEDYAAHLLVQSEYFTIDINVNISENFGMLLMYLALGKSSNSVPELDHNPIPELDHNHANHNGLLE